MRWAQSFQALEIAQPTELRTRLARVWGTPSGIIGALSSVDHQIVRRRYIVTAFLFLFLAMGWPTHVPHAVAVRFRGFFFNFITGGLIGVMLASVPLDT